MATNSSPKTLNPKVKKELSGVSLVVERALFYRDGFRNLVMIAIIEAIAILVLIICLIIAIYGVAHKQSTYFAMAPNGSLQTMIPLNEPTIPESRMAQIVSNYATCVYTYDYVNFRKQLALCEPGFTTNGWVRFVKELEASKTMALVQTEQIVVSSAAINAPIVADRGLIEGVMAWKVEMPIRVTYSGRQNKTTEDYKVTMTVARANQTEHSDGIAISNIVSTRIQGS